MELILAKDPITFYRAMLRDKNILSMNGTANTYRYSVRCLKN